MRWLLSFVLTVGMAAALPLSAPATAHACSCAYEPNGPYITEQISRAAAAFTGTATRERTDGDTVYYEFDVHSVFTGDVGSTTVVSSSTQGSACGRGFTLGIEYLAFVSTHETKNAPWSVEACSATTTSTNAYTRDAAHTVYGPPHQPDPQTRPIGIDDIRPLWQKSLLIIAVFVLAAMLMHRWAIRGRHH